jgi:hypothetical protein
MLTQLVRASAVWRAKLSITIENFLEQLLASA